MYKTLDQFNLRLDRLLGITSKQTILPAVPDPAVEAALQTAGILTGMDLAAEAAPWPELRQRWAQATAKSPAALPTRIHFPRRLAWIVAMILALALLVAFRQPVMAAVGRMFGYIYVQDAGFLPADSTLVLRQPVMQEHNGLSLTVTHGVATPDGTTLYLEFSATASPADGAFLETNSGSHLALSYWEYFPNTPGSHGLKLVFPTLPDGTTQTTLVLPAGWHLPLGWIPAASSGLPDVRAVPYGVNVTQSPAPAADLCVEKYGLRLCLQAATGGAESTSVLLEAQATNPALIPSSDMGLVMQSKTDPVTLRDEKGNIYSMDNRRPAFGGTLTFPALAGTHTLTLTIPAVYASTVISQQDISVDVGTDPQPGDVIPLDANIQVLGATVHFSKATFIGDGVGSLRLTLNADGPIQTVDGLTPEALELGRPARVDDLYGGGALVDGKGLFVELIQGGTKITGVLDLPIVSATVIVQGPFTFTFNLSDLPAFTPTPLVANPQAFSPASTPTPMPLGSYSYSGRRLESGDLLYTVIAGDKTNLYAYTPAAGSQASLVATLPGALSQIYIHPDRLGMDYLAGIQVTRDGTTYIDSMSLYTLNFGEAGPRLLYTFSANAGGMIGTAVAGNWSYDGRFVVFDTPPTQPSTQVWNFVWFDLSCRTAGKCESHEIVVPQDFSLSYPFFAPHDYRILFSGLDTGIGGIPGIFLLNFDPLQPNKPLVKIQTNMSILDNTPAPAIWTPDGKIFTDCWDGTAPTKDLFCKIDPVTGVASHGEPVSQNLGGYRPFWFAYWLAPSGDQLVDLLFPQKPTDASVPDLRLLDWNGHLSAIVASSFSITNAMFSPTGQSIAYLIDDKPRIVIYDVPTRNHITVFEGSAPSALSWMGWVP
jgi:WD40 repeat protein